MNDTQYYITRLDSRQEGPYSEAALLSRVLAGKYPDGALVWFEGEESWQPLANILFLKGSSPVSAPASPQEKELPQADIPATLPPYPVPPHIPPPPLEAAASTYPTQLPASPAGSLSKLPPIVESPAGPAPSSDADPPLDIQLSPSDLLPTSSLDDSPPASSLWQRLRNLFS